MKIRSYKPSDYSQVKKLWENAGAFDKSYDKKEKLDAKKPKGSIIVADGNGKIIGTIIYTWDNWDSSIYRFAVDPKYQGKGLGAKLLEEAEKRLKKHSADVSSLRTDAKNIKAQKFFKKHRYRKVGHYFDFEKRL